MQCGLNFALIIEEEAPIMKTPTTKALTATLALSALIVGGQPPRSTVTLDP